MSFGNMRGLWDYIGKVISGGKSVYVTGGLGQPNGDGKYKYDCHGLIKSYAYTNNKVYGAISYKGNGLSTDDMISTVYDKATKKGNIDTLPKSGIYCVYLDNDHIGIYNASTKTTRECCAGNTNKCIERPLSFYNNTPYKWNKWSNLYWCSEDSSVDVSNTSVKTVGYLDEVTYTNGKVIFSGWAFNPKYTCNVDLFIDNVKVNKENVEASKSREDVMKALNLKSSNVGYKYEHSCKLSPGKHTMYAKVGNDKLTNDKSITIQDSGYKVQVASFTTELNAKNFVRNNDKLSSKLYIYIVGGIYKVVCGNEADKSKLNSLLAEAKSKLNKDAYIIK